MAHITEMMPNADRWPEWAKTAFEEGNFFETAVKKVSELEQKVFELETQPSGCLQALTNWIDGLFGSK